MRRRLLAFALTAALSAGFLIAGATPASAAACPTASGSYSGGDGSSGSPYLISTPGDLQRLQETSSGLNSAIYFKFTADIDMGGCTWSHGIGYMSTFDGTILGSGHVVSGVDIATTDRGYVGFVEYLSGSGSIHDLGFTGNVSGSLSGSSANLYIGGLVGFTVTPSVIANSFATGNVSGAVTATASNCVFCFGGGGGFGTGTLIAGGLIGYAQSVVSNSYASGAVSGSATAASNAYVSGAIGGLAGVISSGDAYITNSFSTGSVSPSTMSVSAGGFAGEADAAYVHLTNNFWDTTTSGWSSATAAGGAVTGVTGAATAALKTASTVSAWNPVLGWQAQTFSSDVSSSPYWGICTDGSRYPFLLWQYSSDPCAPPSTCPTASSSFSGAGTSADPYLISTPGDLQRLHNTSAAWSKVVKFTADINMGGCVWTTAIANGSLGLFTGTLLGGGHVVSGLDIAAAAGQGYVGFIGYLGENGSIHDFGFTGDVSTSASGESIFVYAGGLVGFTFTPTLVANSFATGDVTASLSVSECSSFRCFGGGTAYVGGLIGASQSVVRDSYATGNPSASITLASGASGYASVGGLAGVADGATPSISNSYSTGTPSTSTPDNVALGGFAGYANTTSLTLTGNRWDTSASGLSAAAANQASITGITGTTTADMRAAASYSTWDLVTGWQAQTYSSGVSSSPYWGICADGSRYPFLLWQYSTNPCVPPSACPTAAGSYSGGTGSSGDPYLISTPADLQKFSETGAGSASNHYYKFTEDIDMGGCTWSHGVVTGGSFVGTILGGGHVVSGLNIVQTTGGDVGFVNSLSGRIYDLGFTGNVTGSLTSSMQDLNVGGLVGAISMPGLVANSFATGNVSGDLTAVSNPCMDPMMCMGPGGFTVHARVGGLVGSQDAVVTNSYATGSASVSVTSAGSDAQGFVGGFAGTSESFQAESHNNFSTGAATTSTPLLVTVGGFIGYTGIYITLTDNFWNTTTSGLSAASGNNATLSGVTGATTANLKKTSTFSAWSPVSGWQAQTYASGVSTSPHWGICAGDTGYPFLLWQYSSSPCTAVPPTPMTLTMVTPTNGATAYLPLGGTVTNISIDWGDSNSTGPLNSSGVQSHTYATAGTYTVKISGTALSCFGCMDVPANLITAVSSWGELGITNLSYAFSGAQALTSVPAALPAGVTDLHNTFTYATIFNGDLSGWDTSQVTNMAYMFYGATAFNNNGVSLATSGANWNTGKVTDMNNMFASATAFNQPIGSWDVSKVTSFSQTFYAASAFNKTLAGWNTALATDMSAMFYGATAFNQDVSGFDTSKVTDMNHMFTGATAFNNGGAVGDHTHPLEPSTGHWDLSSVGTVAGMFGGANKFDQRVNNWDLSNVTDAGEMFHAASAFNQDISSWKTPKLVSMNYMFADASAFNNGGNAWPEASGHWSTAKVTTAAWAFAGASAFNADISSWNTAKLGSAWDMFIGATSFNADISGWDTSSLANADDMFNGASAFNRNLAGWDTTSLTSADRMFKDSGLSTANYSALLKGWATHANQQNVTFGAQGIKYKADAATARATLTGSGAGKFSWTITDGGQVPVASITTAPTASSIRYGQTLADSTLSGGVATPAGTFAWETPSTAPDVGSQSYTVTYTPTDPSTESNTTSATVQVNKALTSITTNPTASAITIGQALTASTLSGGVGSKAGTFAWTTASTVPSATGTQSYSVTFTPTDAAHYETSTTTVSVLVNKVITSVLYTGDLIAMTQSSFKASASTTGSALCTPVSYALDRNPTNQATSEYALTQGSSGSVSTTNWQEGVYQLTVRYGGYDACTAASDLVTLTVAAAGANATGGGAYTMPSVGRVNFGFTVRTVPNTKPAQYRGQLVLVNNGKWKLKGNLSTYVISGGVGKVQGIGTLSWWDSSANGGLGAWVVASSSVSFTASFTATSGKTPGSFGIQILYTPVSPQPSTLPNSSTLTALKGGKITAA